MNDFDNLLASEFGLKPQGRAAPMSASKGSSTSSFRSTPNDDVFNSIPNHHKKNLSSDDPFADLFTAKSDAPFRVSSADFGSRSVNLPAYDKPVYDDDIFDGIPGLKSSAKVTYDDVFASVDSGKKGEEGSSGSSRGGGGGGGGDSAFDDLLGGFGKLKSSSFGGTRSEKGEKGVGDFDDLIPGFGSSKSNTSDRPSPDIGLSSEPTVSASKTTFSTADDPFKVFESTSAPVDSPSGQYTDPLDEISKLSSGTKHHSSSYSNGGVYDDIDPFDGLGKSVPAFSSERSSGNGSSSPAPRSNSSSSWNRDNESFENSSVRSPERRSQNKIPVEHDQEFHQAPFDIPTYSSDSNKPAGQRSTSPASDNDGFKKANIEVDMSPKYEENSEPNDDIWLTVSEIPLFTQPTAAPPPSRPPPPRPVHIPKSETGSSASANARKKDNETSSFPSSTRSSHFPNSAPAAAKLSPTSQFDELENFAMGRSSGNHNEHGNDLPDEELEMNSAAVKEAMDRAEAKFRHAKEVRERENRKAARNKESVQLEKDDITVLEERAKQERLEHERQQKEREEKEHRRLEREREEKERERQRLEREREKARQAVERATREARERAATEARQRAERAAVGKAHAEARERAERAAVQRAQAEARERAAAEAKERAEKAAAEAKERERAAAARAEAEARVKAERAAVERAAAEARERAAAEARERAAAAARANQQKNENDLESFFSMGSRASSAPRPPRPSSSDSVFDTQFPQGASSSMKKPSSSTNIVDDLSSIFGAAPSSSGEFQDIEGESEERRRARLDRHQRTQERVAQALAEKNQRDLQTQREQAERHRLAETLDFEVKRWAAGKEGNLRALLSTLQYVLWPECGWQPVSLTDLIAGASVKKAYRKATLCIHPDKVQQKGATLQQKYIAEKVFDILKEAWNKFDSEELF
ncbi:hypothetical protein RIF29_10916 [Crotalaria pallida]|uniref:Uncharacterized protein n=1 Tax=Crotalaria pallida TaxID=3830 RepID=A0AAN9FZE3_CROPI